MTRRCIIVVLFAAAFAAVPAASARADDAPYLPWPELLVSLPGTYSPSSEDACRSGHERCVDAVIRFMDWRLRNLARSCDHDAVFELVYLRTTEEYLRAAAEPGFFVDPAFVNHQDVVFALYYFDAFAKWHSGRREDTPRAWAIAFEAAEERELPAYGNIVLGVNAHVQRDLPIVLAALGLVRPDGGSRKTDHDRVNRFLNRVFDDAIAEVARRFDPTADDTNLPTAIDEVLSFQVLPTWRETAWRNAERLAAARTSLERKLVLESIEAYAASQARTLRRAAAYPLGQDSSARDAYCAENG